VSTMQRSRKHANAREISACAGALRSDSKSLCACEGREDVEEEGKPDLITVETGERLPVRKGS
jgi:hypothetical protein